MPTSRLLNSGWAAYHSPGTRHFQTLAFGRCCKTGKWQSDLTFWSRHLVPAVPQEVSIFKSSAPSILSILPTTHLHRIPPSPPPPRLLPWSTFPIYFGISVNLLTQLRLGSRLQPRPTNPSAAHNAMSSTAFTASPTQQHSPVIGSISFSKDENIKLSDEMAATASQVSSTCCEAYRLVSAWHPPIPWVANQEPPKIRWAQEHAAFRPKIIRR